MSKFKKISLITLIILMILLYTISIVFITNNEKSFNFIHIISKLRPLGIIPSWFIIYALIFIFTLIIYGIFKIFFHFEMLDLESNLFRIFYDKKIDDIKYVNPELRLIFRRIIERINELESDIQNLTSVPELVNDDTKENILQNERKRFARELHDSVSQELFAAMMLVNALEKQISNSKIELTNINKQLSLIAKVINEAQSEMRALLLHLRPLALEDRTLRQSIIHLIDDLESKVGSKIYFDIDNLNLDRQIEDNIFRIIQEIISNILRHAKATEIKIFLKNINDVRIVLRIEDNGVGFDMKNNKEHNYGLKNIEERTYAIGGELKIISLPNKGTSLTIKVPITKETLN